jgi:chromosome condensin MukBEF ATPase and DNA-binding subunit MukB
MIVILSAIGEQADLQSYPQLFEMIWNASLAIAADESRARKLVIALTEVFESAHFSEKTAASVAAILAEDSEDFDRLRPLIKLL